MLESRTPGDVSAAQIRQRIAATPLIPYDQLDTTAKHFSAHFDDVLTDLLTSGFARDGEVLPSLAPPIAFDSANRSFAFHLHAWEPLTFLLQGWCLKARRDCIEASVALALDWIERYQKPLFALSEEDAIQAALNDKSTKAWYDMGVGQRIYRLAFVVDHIAREPETYDDETFRLVFDTLMFHHRLCMRDDFFVGHTNHGLYQALGQLAAARRFLYLKGFDRFHETAQHRLAGMFERSFFPSGTHREHSPGYHHMILGSLLGARRSGLLTPELDETLRRAEHMLAWMITPQGALTTIGDTDLKLRLYRPPHPREYEDAGVRYLWSGGRGGERPEGGVVGVMDAGYAFARVYHGEEHHSQAMYLAQIGGFHSRTHKHADHFSFVWHDRGHEILLDPGRYSYASPMPPPGSPLFEAGHWYSDPKRIYVEKTRAHNCLEIDGQDYQRKKVRPFGSGLKSAEMRDGVVTTVCAATHFRKVRHRRTLVALPADFLIVLDWVYDRSGEAHAYRQWYQVAPVWSLEGDADGLRGRIAEPENDHDRDESLCVVDLLQDGSIGPIMWGQTEPNLAGWRSDGANRLTPCSTFWVDRPAGALGQFATLFAFGREVVVDRARSRVNTSMTAGRLVWIQDGASRSLDFRVDGDRVDVRVDGDEPPVKPRRFLPNLFRKYDWRLGED